MEIARSDQEILKRLCLILPKQEYQKFWDIFMADEVTKNEGFMVDVIQELTWLIHQLEDDKYILKCMLEELEKEEEKELPVNGHYN